MQAFHLSSHRRAGRKAVNPPARRVWHPWPVGAPGYHAYDIAAYLDALRAEGGLLADAAGRAGMGAAVPACPGWSVADLLRHTSYVHRWAAGIVAQRLTRPPPEPSEEEVLQRGPEDDALVRWFREGHAALVRTLEEADPDLDCWAFLSAPSPLAFWARRQAHETAIHRADAEQAAGGAGQAPADGGADDGIWFEPAFAADGVDELIMGFLARNIRRGNWPGLGGSLAIHAEDGPGAAAGWLVSGGPGASAVSRGIGPADCAVTGRASDLYLLLWNRDRAGTVAVTGDPGVLAAFGRELTIAW
jgi:uncharacterized protein (TIGR03083 family)